MSRQALGTINSHNEWDKLEEIIVGTAEGSSAVLTWRHAHPPDPSALERAKELAREAFPAWFLEEIAEDLEGLCRILEGFGVKVFRPTVHDIARVYSSPFWSSTGNNICNVRDLNLVVGNTVIESPSPHECRYFETVALYDIWYKYLENGFRWIAGPKPRLDPDVVTAYFRDESERVLTDEDIRYQQLTGGRLEKLHRLTETEIVFEAANTLRMGRDLLYLTSSAGNRLGAKWIQSVLGDEYRVHTTEGIYRSSHIDSTVFCLKPGLVLLNNARVSEKNTPPLFDRWDKVYFGDVAPTTEQELVFQRDVRDRISAELSSLGFQSNLSAMASPWVGMNFLSVDQQTVIVESRQAGLIKLLEKMGFTVAPVRMRHIYTQGGGIHCATQDTVRQSKLESYFD